MNIDNEETRAQHLLPAVMAVMGMAWLV